MDRDHDADYDPFANVYARHWNDFSDGSGRYWNWRCWPSEAW
ncbi:hypothetical protein [Kroppenstedtia guangzhouensis]|nr:hypothetical protein [Kroppenstedtia guangzhouensis]